MKDETIYVVRGTRWEAGKYYTELGGIETRILEYATGNLDDIRHSYDGKGYMKIEVEPIEVRDHSCRKNKKRIDNRFQQEVAI